MDNGWTTFSWSAARRMVSSLGSKSPAVAKSDQALNYEASLCLRPTITLEFDHQLPVC